MNLVCKKCDHKWDYKGKSYRAMCSSCQNKGIVTWIKTGILFAKNSSPKTHHSSVPSISSDLMSGSLIKALKKAGLDPMKNGQLRDAISTILEKDEVKIAWANALEKKKIDSIRLVRKVLVNWLKEEKYL